MRRVLSIVSIITRRTLFLGALRVLCLLSFLSASQVLAQAPASAIVEGELRSLRVVEAADENVGTVQVNTVASRKVVFRNELKHPVSLSIFSKSCGCLSAKFDSETLQPGEKSTLSLGAHVLPVLGEQAHHVMFKVLWKEDGKEKTERGMCLIRYQPDIEFVVTPTKAGVAAIQGERVHVDIFMRYLTEIDKERDQEHPPLDLAEGKCTLKGWTVTRVDDPSLPSGAIRFRAEGVVEQTGFQTGEITWQSGASEKPAVTVPIRLRTLSPWRASPGGHVFVRDASDEEMARTIRLVRRSETSPAPFAVKLTEPSEWLDVTLVGETVKATLKAGKKMPGIGSARAEVLAENGEILLNFPIVWYTREVPAKIKTPTKP